MSFSIRNLAALLLLAYFLAFTSEARANDVDRQRAFVQVLAKDIVRSGLKKVYLPDFTDNSGQQSVLGRFFAAQFSTMLDENAKDFVVLNRADVHQHLSRSGTTDHDLKSPEALAKFVSDRSPDAILWGAVSVTKEVATIDLVARDPGGKEMFHNNYEEKLDPVLRDDFEASESSSDFYFAGLDGISIPECLHCPVAPYPIGQGSSSAEGNVVLTVLVTAEGKTDQIRLVESLGPVFDSAAIEQVRSWQLRPAHNADGKFAPVRMPIQVTFKRHWQVR